MIQTVKATPKFGNQEKIKLCRVDVRLSAFITILIYSMRITKTVDNFYILMLLNILKFLVVLVFFCSEVTTN